MLTCSRGTYVQEHFEIIDPRPTAASSPYTFFLLSAKALNAVDEGDFVQASIRSVPPSKNVERLWIEVTSAHEQWIEGKLRSTPIAMPKLRKGTAIRLPRSHIIAVKFSTPEKKAGTSLRNRRNGDIGTAAW